MTKVFIRRATLGARFCISAAGAPEARDARAPWRPAATRPRAYRSRARRSGKVARDRSEVWSREDHRRVLNGEQHLGVVNAVLAHPVSRQWKGYWQR